MSSLIITIALFALIMVLALALAYLPMGLLVARMARAVSEPVRQLIQRQRDRRARARETPDRRVWIRLGGIGFEIAEVTPWAPFGEAERRQIPVFALRVDPTELDALVGRMKAAAVPVGQSWMWTLAFGHHEDRTPTHGYAATREAAMAAFAKSWRQK